MPWKLAIALLIEDAPRPDLRAPTRTGFLRVRPARQNLEVDQLEGAT